MENIFTEEKIVDLLSNLEKSRSIAIITHTNPDGDAIGSSGALKSVLETIYPQKKIRAFVPNPYPDFLSWTAKETGVEICKEYYTSRIGFIRNADMIIVTDMNQISRADHLAVPFNENTGYKYLIDHHIGPDTASFKTIFHSTEVSSASALVLALIKAAGWWNRTNLVAASALLCGIITDTGGFSYSCLTADLFRMVADLVDKGADPVAVHQAVFDNQSESRLRLLGYLINNKMTVIPERNAAYITLSNQEKNAFKYKTGDTEGVVNYPMTIEGITTSAIFVENPDYIKVSLRSQGDRINVDAMSRRWFHGGGHFNAAGGKFFGTLEEATKTYREALEELWTTDSKN